MTAMPPRRAFAPAAPFASLGRVRTPPAARWAGRLLLLGFVFAPIVLVFVPWQQTVRGRGQVVAFDPTERKQVVTALVGGQVKKWHVVEGSRVKAGEPIVDIDDNDPDLALRLAKQKEFLKDRLKAAREEMAEQDRAVAAQEKAAAAAVGAAKANREAAAKMVDVAKETKKNNEFALAYEKVRGERFGQMVASDAGLASGLEARQAKMQADQAATNVLRAAAEIDRALAAVQTADSQVLQAEAAGLQAVATARGSLRRAEGGVFDVEQRLQELDTRIQRYEARFVKAPVAGVVFRVAANGGAGGQMVKEGDELAVIVPDAADRVVELLIDGVDAPLVAAHMQQTGRGPHVRLQFEGWPAVQFAGWPSVAVGTFGGRVRQMDPTDDGYGRFRILVEPEEMFPGDTWPEGLFLRQGNQTVGWVFLNRVTLGFELWRQFNGFPPVIAPKPPEKDKDGGKPPKVKPG